VPTKRLKQLRRHPERALLRRNRAWLLAHRDKEITTADTSEYQELIERRREGEPIQYIKGEAEFYGLPFRVTPDVLIPRPETEHLVAEAVALAFVFPKPRVLDVGTGSGAIAIAIAHEAPSCAVTATDVSDSALEIARFNAERTGFAKQIRFLRGDLLTPVAGEQFEIIASNPPYIPIGDRDTLSIEVRDHEPHSALFAGDDGFEIYRRLIPGAFDLLVPNGWLVLEIGFGQQSAIEVLLQSAGYSQIHFIPDYQGIPRVAAAQRS
jgi:release factor glutamine methyltransferase